MLQHIAKPVINAATSRAELKAKIMESRDLLGRDHTTRESRICRLFDAQFIEPRSPIMQYGWERPNDKPICDIVLTLLDRFPRISLLELGSGTTWGSSDRNFGIPGFARILKHAFPHRLNITVTDRECGYDLFIRDEQGRLIHGEFKDDRIPLETRIAPCRLNQTLEPLTPAEVHAARVKDPEFSSVLRRLGHVFDFNPDAPGNAIFVRPRVDSEIEALLYGVRALSGVNYLFLTEDLQKHGELARFDFVFGRHLCPVSLPSRVQHLKDTLPEALASCARHSFVQFDHIQDPGDIPADLIFRHHEFIP